MTAEIVEAWAGFVPLLQTLLWILFAGSILYLLRSQLAALAESIRERISAGDDLETPWGSLRGAPKEVRGEGPGVATAEGAGGATTTTADVQAALESKSYPAGIVDNVYLVHEAQTIRARRAGKPGLWRVRVWLEAYNARLIGSINRVTYRLYDDDFPRPVISTEDRSKDYELWLSVYGEFTVVAYVEREGQDDVWLTRYLDLPGRPPE